MINSNHDPISHCFRDTATYSWKLFVENCGQTAADKDMVTMTVFELPGGWTLQLFSQPP